MRNVLRKLGRCHKLVELSKTVFKGIASWWNCVVLSINRYAYGSWKVRAKGAIRSVSCIDGRNRYISVVENILRMLQAVDVWKVMKIKAAFFYAMVYTSTCMSFHRAFYSFLLVTRLNILNISKLCTDRSSRVQQKAMSQNSTSFIHWYYRSVRLQSTASVETSAQGLITVKLVSYGGQGSFFRPMENLFSI